MKVVQIAVANNSVIALDDQGSLHYGFFIDQGSGLRPKFMWRKIPIIKKDEQEYERERELAPDEIQKIVDQRFKNEKDLINRNLELEQKLRMVQTLEPHKFDIKAPKRKSVFKRIFGK